jgi:hypothetical protein
MVSENAFENLCLPSNFGMRLKGQCSIFKLISTHRSLAAPSSKAGIFLINCTVLNWLYFRYFQTKAEKQGKSTLADPLAIVGILSIFLPFIILGAAFTAGLVKLPS